MKIMALSLKLQNVRTGKPLGMFVSTPPRFSSIKFRLREHGHRMHLGGDKTQTTSSSAVSQAGAGPAQFYHPDSHSLGHSRTFRTGCKGMALFLPRGSPVPGADITLNQYLQLRLDVAHRPSPCSASPFALACEIKLV